jgi:cytochrome c oxidase subunit 4
MLRTQATSVLRKSLVRSHVPLARAASTHAISNPTLSNIEKRWEGMPLQEQADLWMALRDRMKGSWKELTVQEQKAGACFYTILRSQAPPPKHLRPHDTEQLDTTVLIMLHLVAMSTPINACLEWPAVETLQLFFFELATVK